MFAMINWPEVFVILMILGIVLCAGAVVLFFIIRAASESSQLQKRVERLEKELEALRKTPPRNP